MSVTIYVLLGTIRKHSPPFGEDVCIKFTFFDDSTHGFMHLKNKHTDTKYPTDVSFVGQYILNQTTVFFLTE